MALAGAAVLVAAVAAVGGRMAAESPPPLRATRVLAERVAFPGRTSSPAWPASGQATVDVEGVGSLGSAGGDEPVPIASVTKLMTAYLVVQDHPLASGAGGFDVTITPAEVADQQARVADDESTVRVAAGEVLDERQLLEALLLASANNIAMILASEDAGSVAAFVHKMNDAAAAFGLHHTTYTDPSGLLPTTVSTAADQLVVAERFMAVPVLAAMVEMASVTLPVAGKVMNTNGLVGQDGFIGIKTGSDTAAGGCLAFASRRTVGGRPVTVFGVILSQDRGQSNDTVVIEAALHAAKALTDSVFRQLAVRPVVTAGTPVFDVVDADGRHVEAVTASDIPQLGWPGLPVTVRVSAVPLGSQLRSGQRVATVVARVGQDPPGRAAAVAASTMPGVSFGWRLRHAL